MNVFVIMLAVIGGMATIAVVVGAVVTLCEMHEDLQINRAKHNKMLEEIYQLRRDYEAMKEQTDEDALRNGR